MASWLLLFLGNRFAASQMPTMACSCYRLAAAGSGRVAVIAACKLGDELLKQDKSEELCAVLSPILETKGEHQARAWRMMGIARRRLGELALAREAYERAAAIDPSSAATWNNLAEWHLAQGEAEQAMPFLDRALACDAKLPEALNNRVAALIELGRNAEAEEAAGAALKILPKLAALHANLGYLMLCQEKRADAFKHYQEAVACDPHCAEARIGLATLHGEHGNPGAVRKFLEEQIAVRGKSLQRLTLLALVQKAEGKLAAAEATCNEILETHTEDATSFAILAGVAGAHGEPQRAIDLLKRVEKVNPADSSCLSCMAFNATYLGDASPHDVYEMHAEWSRRFEVQPQAEGKAEGPEARVAGSTRPTNGRPLRIAYVSGDFSTHPVGHLVRDVVRNHDAAKVSITCYSMMRGGDQITAAIKEAADSWVDILFMDDDELEQRIRDDKIDILVDLSGHTAYHRLSVFVRRPAPVQVTWIGYFHSTGLKCIDYFITDPYTSPPGSPQLFSETPVYLPHSRFCYSPPDYAPPVAPLPCQENGYVTFGCFNRTDKLSQPVIELWSRILHAVPDSRMVLKAGSLRDEGVRKAMEARFAHYGIDLGRLELRPASPHLEMFQQYGDIDLALDPFPFNGGMTTLEALWMGVPVLTLVGQGVVSRQTYSVLKNIGLADELATPDVDAYAAKAIALANDRIYLAQLRQGLRARMAASPVCDPAQFARDLESLFVRMWDAYEHGQKLPSALIPTGGRSWRARQADQISWHRPGSYCGRQRRPKL
ncbi:MAG: tetratricopeptide repeat protein [Sulfurisoma sp.]|nr:tetratricopeptide repeat protein [Sulfurisoma sp.]